MQNNFGDIFSKSMDFYDYLMKAAHLNRQEVELAMKTNVNVTKVGSAFCRALNRSCKYLCFRQIISVKLHNDDRMKNNGIRQSQECVFKYVNAVQY